MKEPVKVTKFKEHIHGLNFDVERTTIDGITTEAVVNRLDDAIVSGWRVEYHVDGKVYT